MAERKRINYINIFVIIFLMSLILISYLYWSVIKVKIRDILELKGLYIVLFSFTMIVYLISFFSNTESSYKGNPIGSSYGRFFDTIINGLTYGTAISSSLTLIKGFYIQKIFEDKQYFFEFSIIDVWLLFLTMCFLLYFCLERVIETVKELIWTTESIEIDEQ